MTEQTKNKNRSSFKKIAGIGLLVIGALGIAKIIKMKKIGDNVITKLVNPRVHKVDTKGISFRTEITLQNPTNSTMKITKPVVYLSTNGTQITNSNIENKVIEIKALQNTNIDTIELQLSWIQLIPFVSTIVTNIPSIIQAVKNKTSITEALGIPLEMNYTLYANNLFIKSEPTKLI